MDSRYIDTVLFFENGKIKQRDGNDMLKTSYGYHWEYLYDAAKRLIKINKTTYIDNKTDTVELSYDSTGYLSKVHDKNHNSIVDIDITNLPDGRAKDAIARDGSGKALWRIEYEYGDHTVSIQEFDNRLGRGVQTKSIFSIDDKGRVISAEVAESGVGLKESNAFYATYRYSYQTDGSKALDIESYSNYGTKPGANCHQHREYFANGAENWSKIKVNCPNFIVFGPGGSPQIPENVDYKFDKTGNLVQARSGKPVTELGPRIIRWNYEHLMTLTYF